MKTTEIGLSWVTTTMPPASEVWTRLPWSTIRMPVRPAIGEVMLQYPSSTELLFERSGVGLHRRPALVDGRLFSIHGLLVDETFLQERELRS